MADDVLRTFPEASDPFKERSDAHSGLDFAYGAGRVSDEGTVTDAAAGTVTLADDTTNYIEVDVTDGTVSDNTTGFSGGTKWPLYTAVTSSGSITTVTDKRSFFVSNSGGGATGILTTKGDLLTYTTTEARLAVGTDGQVVRAKAAATEGVAWLDDVKGICLPIWDDPLTTGDDQLGALIPTGLSLTIVDVRVQVLTAPTDASLIVDVHKNGTTIFTTQANRPTITTGNTSDTSATPDVTTLTAGDYVTACIDQVGSTEPGEYLMVTISCKAAV